MNVVVLVFMRVRFIVVYDKLFMMNLIKVKAAILKIRKSFKRFAFKAFN